MSDISDAFRMPFERLIANSMKGIKFYLHILRIGVGLFSRYNFRTQTRAKNNDGERIRSLVPSTRISSRVMIYRIHKYVNAVKYSSYYHNTEVAQNKDSASLRTTQHILNKNLKTLFVAQN